MSWQTKVEMKWNGEDVKIKGRKVVNKTAYETGLIVEGQAKELCTVDTGYLRGSINTQSATKGTSPEASDDGRTAARITKPSDEQEVLVGTVVDYAPHQEFLHRPFLRPALDLAKGQIVIIGMENGRLELRDYLVRKG